MRQGNYLINFFLLVLTTFHAIFSSHVNCNYFEPFLLLIIFFLVNITNTTIDNPINKKGITIFQGKVFGLAEILVWLLSMTE